MNSDNMSETEPSRKRPAPSSDAEDDGQHQRPRRMVSSSSSSVPAAAEGQGDNSSQPTGVEKLMEAQERYLALYGLIASGCWSEDIGGLVSRLKNDLKEYPIISTIISRDQDYLLNALISSKERSAKISEDLEEAIHNSDDYKEALKLLIISNPDALLRRKEVLYQLSDDLFPWIAKTVGWVFDKAIEKWPERPVHFKLLTKGGKLLPGLVVEESHIREFYRHYHAGLTQTDESDNTFLHIILDIYCTFGPRSISVDLIKWIVSLCPDALLLKNRTGDTPLENALAILDFHLIDGADPTPTLQVCDYLLQENPDAMTRPLGVRHTFLKHCGERQVQEFMTKILRVMHNCSTMYTSTSNRSIFVNRMEPLLRQEAQVIRERTLIRQVLATLKKGSRPSSNDIVSPNPKKPPLDSQLQHQVTETYVAWSKTRLEGKVLDIPRVKLIRQEIERVNDEVNFTRSRRANEIIRRSRGSPRLCYDDSEDSSDEDESITNYD
jgi:hypothetical protein